MAKISKVGQIFVSSFSYAEKDIPKNAGWLWHGGNCRRGCKACEEGIGKVWWTPYPEKAAPLAAYCDEGTQKALETYTGALEASRATDLQVELNAPQNLAYLPYQKAGIQYALGRKGTLLADEMGLGKGCIESTPVLTPKGWKKISELKVGDKVIGGSTGKPVNVTGVFPQGLKDVFKITFNDKETVIVDEDHLWAVGCDNDYRRKRGWRIVSTQQLLTMKHPSWEIPMVPPVVFDRTKKLSLDPYILGCLLGNGGIIKGTPKIHTRHKEQIEIIRKLLENLSPKLYIDGPMPSDMYAYSITTRLRKGKNTVNPLIEELRKINVWGKKDIKKSIPKKYMYASIDDRLSLLQGLLDTDGTVKKSRIRFSSSSKKLAKQVIWLVRSLGGWASLSKVLPEKRAKNINYIVIVQVPNDIIPFRLQYHKDRMGSRKKRMSRKIHSIKPQGQQNTICISVDDPSNLYVIKSFIVTHNTVQALGVINNDDSLKTVTVVCPASLRLNWLREATKWLTRPFSFYVVENNNPIPEEASFIIVNFDRLKGDILDSLMNRGCDCLIVDEAHYLKNQKAQRTTKVFGSSNKKFREMGLVNTVEKKILLLTGTPIVNRPAELFSLLNALDKQTYSNFFGFAKRYCNAHHNGWGWDFSGAANLEELQNRLRATCMVRRLKADVLPDLPEKRRQIIVIPTNGATKAVKAEQKVLAKYAEQMDALKECAQSAQESGDAQSYEDAVNALSSFYTAAFEECARERKEVAIAKAPYVVEHVKEMLESGIEKVIVWAHHHEVTDLLAAELGALKADGRDSLEKRQQAVDTFQSDPSAQVIVCGMRAMGEGHTLTAASHVVFAELDWTPGKVSQCEDRAHRIGQKNNVLIQHIVLDESIDATLAQTIVRKQEIIEQGLNVQYKTPTLPKILEKKESPAPACELKISEELQNAVTTALHTLTSVCDGAKKQDGHGFNKIDTAFGHHLANVSFRRPLTPKEVLCGKKMALRYKKQLPAEIVTILGKKVSLGK